MKRYHFLDEYEKGRKIDLGEEDTEELKPMIIERAGKKYIKVKLMKNSLKTIKRTIIFSYDEINVAHGIIFAE